MPAAEPRTGGSPDDSARPSADDVARVLSEGELTVTGRISDASNLTLLATATLDLGDSRGPLAVDCVYKPVRGERPLWDFPDGTLAARERAAYVVSRTAGWDCVPLTILRPGPYGQGMVQRWVVTPDDADEVVDLVPIDQVVPGWLPVLRAVDTDGTEVAVAHADRPALARLAGFDIVVNNADRKGSHVLTAPDGRILGVDHGLCFHGEDKLRTILWGWAGDELPDDVRGGVGVLRTALDGELGAELDELITVAEVTAFRRRLDRLLERPVFPRPPSNRSPIPWPPL